MTIIAKKVDWIGWVLKICSIKICKNTFLFEFNWPTNDDGGLTIQHRVGSDRW